MWVANSVLTYILYCDYYISFTKQTRQVHYLTMFVCYFQNQGVCNIHLKLLYCGIMIVLSYIKTKAEASYYENVYNNINARDAQQLLLLQ